MVRCRSLLLPILALALSAVSPALAATGDRFTLESARDNRIWGPFASENGTRIELDGRLYELRLGSDDRISFVDVRAGRVFGPLQTVDGRLVEIGGQMFSYARSVAAAVARPALPPPPRPPARPPPIPVPQEGDPSPVAAVRPILPPHRDGASAAFWADLVDDTPLEWEVAGLRGADSTLERTSLGAGLVWRGWSVQAAVSESVSADDIVPTGFGVTEARLVDGSGWRLSAGYRQPFLREAGWEAYAGARVVLRQDKVDIATQSAVATATTNNTTDLTFASAVGSLTLTEFALWLDAGLSYSREFWGLYLDVGVLPFYDLSVDGGMPHGGGTSSVEASRAQPLTAAGGVWVGRAPWRFFGEVAAGADQRLRIGTTFDF